MERKSELTAIAQMRGGDAILTRLRWFEDSIVWRGRCTSRGLADRFGVSRAQGAHDIAAYIRLAPGNVDLHPARRFYFATDAFEPVFPKDPRSFIETEQATPEGFDLPIERLYDPWKILKPTIVAALTSAAVMRRPLAIILSGGDAAEFCPYRLIDDGRRILVRGWNHEHGEVRTYAVAEILKAVPDPLVGWVGSDADVTHAPFRRSAEQFEGTAS